MGACKSQARVVDTTCLFEDMILCGTYNSKESTEYDYSKGEESYECVGVDVWVSVLKYLHQKKATNDEHESSI